MDFLKPSDVFDVLCYLERDKNHRRNFEAVDTFKRWPEEVQAIIRPHLTGPFPSDPTRQQMWRQAQDALDAHNAGKKQAEAAPVTETDECEESDSGLLPFEGFPGYALDDSGRPHGTGGQGRRRGPLKTIRQWKPRKGQKPRFIFGYRLYREGKQVFRSALSCAIARTNAERSLWEANLGDEK